MGEIPEIKQVPEELAAELSKLRKKDKFYTWIFAGLIGFGLISGAWIYTGRTNAQVNSNNSTARVKSSVASYSGTGGLGSAAGGSCCGVAGTGTATKADLTQLETQALAKFKTQFGDQKVTAKATDYGCHIQIDIYDSSNKVIHSYAYRGGQMNLIQ